MNNYEFSPARIASWMEKIGADIRPPIEIGLEEERIQTFSKWARRTFPQIFDRMVLGASRFEMAKTLEYPGKPSVDVSTFVLTQRGAVFVMPRVISEIDLEPDLPKINEVFRQCMKQFLQHLPGRRVIRVGKINEYVFDCEQLLSIRLVAERFSKVRVPEDGEVFIRFNVPDSDYNRIFALEPVVGKRQPRPDAPLENSGFGVKVTVDVNNRRLDKELSEPEWMTVLNAADVYNRDDIYAILNCEGQEDLK